MSNTNKQLVEAWFEEVWNKKRREVIAEMLSPDSVVHEGGVSARGPEGFYPFFDRMQASFSDFRVTVEDIVTDGDKTCVRWSCTMRHTGNAFDLAPTGKQLHTTGITIIRTANGKIIEGWQNWDMLALMQQITDRPLAPTYVAAKA